MNFQTIKSGKREIGAKTPRDRKFNEAVRRARSFIKQAKTLRTLMGLLKVNIDSV